MKIMKILLKRKYLVIATCHQRTGEIYKNMMSQTFKSDCKVKETFHAFWTSLKSRTHWSFASLSACLSPKTSCFRSWISFSFSYNSLRASFAYKNHHKLNFRRKKYKFQNMIEVMHQQDTKPFKNGNRNQVQKWIIFRQVGKFIPKRRASSNQSQVWTILWFAFLLLVLFSTLTLSLV